MNVAVNIAAPQTLFSGRVPAEPSFEGCNINTWIGFKHVCYMFEEAVLKVMRRAGHLPHELYETQALCFEITASDTRILHAFHLDDMVEIEVQGGSAPGGERLEFHATAYVTRGGREIKAATSVLAASLRCEEHLPGIPDQLKPFVVTRIGDAKAPARDPVAGTAAPAQTLGRGQSARDEAVAAGLVKPDANVFAWKWRVPYFYCYYNDRLRHSGYLRLMEEVVDLFLADRGISIKHMVDFKRLIPVVPHARVNMLAECHMEEEILTLFEVTSIFKGFTYTANMDCYARRGGSFVKVQSGEITHGYARMLDRRDWKLEPFDPATIAAIAGKA